MQRILLFLLACILGWSCNGNRQDVRHTAMDSSGTATQAETASTVPVSEAALKTALPLDKIRLPQGFAITVFSDKVKGARSMTLSPDGTLFVGTRDDKVYALPDKNKDGIADQVYTIASGLNSPNGVAFRNGSLYVAEIGQVTRYDNIESNLQSPPKPVMVNNSFPKEDWHGWKYIAFGPDGKLYIPVGAPCNVCEVDEKHGILMRMNANGSGLEVYAKGIRNTVGFDWNPADKAVWFTDNGRDMLGDDVPSDELNRAPRAGMNFGFPYCHEGDIQDPKFNQHTCSEFVPPVAKLGAHVASLGMKFYTGSMFPADYKNAIFIAEHGSWNRSSKVGYRVMLVKVNGDKVVSQQVFAEGWLKNGNAWGRPVDVLVMPDGSLLVSDDEAGAIYRIVYKG